MQLNRLWLKNCLMVIGVCLELAACARGEVLLPTAAAVVNVPTLSPVSGEIPPTWTVSAGNSIELPTPITFPTRTPRPAPTAPPTFPSRTPIPSQTPTPSQTPLPQPTAIPATSTPFIASPTASSGTPFFITPTLPPVPTPPNLPNLLPNGSFEEGWYNLNGIPELQIPNGWTFEWDEGYNPLDSQPWNVFVRPETRVLPKEYLPPAEHSLFIYDGSYTVKVFKEYGAISFRLFNQVYLQAGEYLLQVSVFPDMIVDYTADQQKVWAPDPLTAEVRLLADGGSSLWILPQFGRKNNFVYRFTVTEAHHVQVGVAMRGRWAIANNGWFFDDWKLWRLGDAGTTP